MYSVDKIVSKEISRQLHDGKRVVNIKLPTHEDFNESITVQDFDIYFWNISNEKVRFKPKKNNINIPWLIWLVKVALFVLQTIFSFPVSIYTLFGLSLDGIFLGKNSFSNDNFDKTLIKSVSKHIRIHKSPRTQYKKLKKVICFTIEDKTALKHLNSALILVDLINNKYVSDAAIVILSKVPLVRPEQTILPIDDLSIEESRFVNDFGMDILTCLRNEDYVSATRYLSEFIIEQGVSKLSVFNFVMQCLAFCFKNLNCTDFKELFSSNSLNIQQEINFGLDKKFVEFSATEQNFLKFCYGYIQRYYHGVAGIQSDDNDARFTKIIEDIKSALYNKNEYLSAAKLYSKFATTENAVDSFIIAFVHSKFIDNTVSDECLLSIKQYKNRSIKADLFLQAFELSENEHPTVDEVNAIINILKDSTISNPILRLCYYYLLVNPVYKTEGCCYEQFLNDFRAAYIEIPSGNDAFKCLFGSQFLLLLTTIENVALRKKYSKFAENTLQFVRERKELLKDKNVYIRICRCMNGILVDNFHSNLDTMKNAVSKNNIKDREVLYLRLNLGAMYTYCGQYSSSIKAYKKISSTELKCLPLSIRSTFKNNLAIFRYKANPSCKEALKQYNTLSNYLVANYQSTIAEESRHIAINIAFFSILANLNRDLIDESINRANALCNDNYYKFYVQQVRLLYAVLYNVEFPNQVSVDSVFFINKKSFFEQKHIALSHAREQRLTDIAQINAFLAKELSAFSNDFDYFKNADMFSLIERWYE